MSPDIVIRAAEPADITAVTEILNQPKTYWGTLQWPYMSVALRDKRFDLADPNRAELVATIDGKVVGQAGVFRHASHRRSHAATIGIAVHEQFTGQGVGSALMAALIDLAERWWGVRRLELEVFADNTRAIALYERFGFVAEGRFKAHAFRDGEYVDGLAMARLSF